MAYEKLIESLWYNIESAKMFRLKRVTEAGNAVMKCESKPYQTFEIPLAQLRDNVLWTQKKSS